MKKNSNEVVVLHFNRDYNKKDGPTKIGEYFLIIYIFFAFTFYVPMLHQHKFLSRFSVRMNAFILDKF